MCKNIRVYEFNVIFYLLLPFSYFLFLSLSFSIKAITILDADIGKADDLIGTVIINGRVFIDGTNNENHFDDNELDNIIGKFQKQFNDKFSIENNRFKLIRPILKNGSLQGYFSCDISVTYKDAEVNN